MHGNYTQLYVHCIWATWDRLPLITPAVERDVFACIVAKCKELKCDAIAVGGIEDHVHLLAHLSPNMSISQLTREVKGASSHLMTHKLSPDVFFKWQGGYGAFTISHDNVVDVATYVKNQKAHHANSTLRGELEKWGEEF